MPPAPTDPLILVDFHLQGSFSISAEQWAALQAELDGKPMIKGIAGSLFQAYFAHLHRYHVAEVKTGKTAKGKTARVDITLLPEKAS